MTKQEELFSAGHNRLLNIAVWAKYLAWVVLVVYILWAIGIYIQEQNNFLFYRAMNAAPRSEFMGFLKEAPLYGLSVLVEMIGLCLKGAVYFLVLKAIALGLNMIVETDINYREQEKGTQ